MSSSARYQLELRAFGERPPSESEPARLARGLDVAGVKPGRIGANGAHPDSHGIRGGAELVHAATALLPGHPTGLRDHDAPIQRDGGLVGDERAPGGDPCPPGLVLPTCEAAGLAVQELDVHPRLAQTCETLAVGLRIGVRRTYHDARDSGSGDRLHTRRRAAVVGAGFERDVERRVSRPLARSL